MLPRVLGLIALSVVGIATLCASGFWIRIVASNASDVAQQRANYYAYMWLMTFIVIAGFWVWLLVKTIRYRAHLADVESQNSFDATEERT